MGAHLSGLPLNRELVDLGASFSREVETTPDYRLFALPGSAPAKPGLLRVADGAGSAIKAEVWTLDRAGFGDFVARIPAPLGIGTIRLKDGGSVKGFLVEAEAVKAAEDVSRFGGWRAYLELPLTPLQMWPLTDVGAACRSGDCSASAGYECASGPGFSRARSNASTSRSRSRTRLLPFSAQASPLAAVALRGVARRAELVAGRSPSSRSRSAG